MSKLQKFVFYLEPEDAEHFKAMVEKTGLGISGFIRFQMLPLIEQYRQEKEKREQQAQKGQ